MTNLCESCIGCECEVPINVTVNECKSYVKRTHEKPPLGVTPKFIVDGNRKRELVEAIDRSIRAEYPIRLEWIIEYNEICNRHFGT